MNILAISGSLKARSINSAALRAAARAAPDGIVVTIEDSVGRLPHFSPDLEADPPEVVQRFRAACDAADGVVLAVPEYAFGIPGAFKNALDWTVGGVGLHRKPVAVLSVAPSGRGAHVRAALAHVLEAVGADVVNHAVPLTEDDRDDDGEIAERRLVHELRAVVEELAVRAVRLRSSVAC
jgi:NAD(P)H-dependent FMN reductase